MEQTTNPPRPGYTKAHPKIGGCLLGLAALAGCACLIAYMAQHDVACFVLGWAAMMLGGAGIGLAFSWPQHTVKYDDDVDDDVLERYLRDGDSLPGSLMYDLKHGTTFNSLSPQSRFLESFKKQH